MPWLIVDGDGILAPEDQPSSAAVSRRLKHPLWAPRAWRVFGPSGNLIAEAGDER